MKDLLKRLKSGETVLADGAMGTMLIERGLKPGECPESYNLTYPEIIEEISRLYIESGADIIQTNTFGASPLKLSGYSLEEKTEEINRNGVLIAKKSAGNCAYVSASCGPTGKILTPYGDTSPEEVYVGYKRQIKALIDAGADIICVETMTDIREAELAIKASKDILPSIPVIATMTFDATSKGFYTIMGVDIKHAASGLKEAGADIIGSNCGNSIGNMIEIAKEFKKYSNLPIVIRPNAYTSSMKDRTEQNSLGFMAEKCKELIALGVSIIGGCCGTTPEHIKAMRRMIGSKRQENIL